METNNQADSPNWFSTLNGSYFLGVFVAGSAYALASMTKAAGGTNPDLGGPLSLLIGLLIATLPQLLLSRYFHFDWTPRAKEQAVPDLTPSYISKASGAFTTGMAFVAIGSMVAAFFLMVCFGYFAD